MEEDSPFDQLSSPTVVRSPSNLHSPGDVESPRDVRRLLMDENESVGGESDASEDAKYDAIMTEEILDLKVSYTGYFM